MTKISKQEQKMLSKWQQKQYGTDGLHPTAKGMNAMHKWVIDNAGTNDTWYAEEAREPTAEEKLAHMQRALDSAKKNETMHMAMMYQKMDEAAQLERKVKEMQDMIERLNTINADQKEDNRLMRAENARMKAHVDGLETALRMLSNPTTGE